MTVFTHLRKGKASMVDVGHKAPTRREAIALGEIRLKPGVLRLLKERKMAKGDALAAARLAAILAAKKTDELIPLCHTLDLECVEVSFLLEKDRIVIRASARAEGKTGVEMEALTAVSVAALTIYDMCKSADKSMVLGPSYLARKTGGKSTYEKAGLPKGWSAPAGEEGSRWL